MLKPITNVLLFVKDSSVTILIVIIASVVVFGWWIHSLHLPSTSRIPGPWYLKFTNLAVLYTEICGQRREWVHHLHLKYGPVVQIAYNEVSFASYTAAKQIYSTGSRDFAKTELYDQFQQDGHINLFTALDAHTHAQIRKPLADKYSNTNILKSKVMEAITERAQTFVRECVAKKSNDVYFYLHAYALDCVTSMLFHPHNARSLEHEDEQEMVHLFSYANVREVVYLAHHFPFLAKIAWAIWPSKAKMARGEKEMRQYVRETVDKGGHSDFTLASRLLSLDVFTRPLLEAECMDHIGAGIETTGDTLCFLMWELSQPRAERIVAKLRTELATATSQQDLANLVYLGAVVQEALRLWAPGTMTLPRYVPAEGRYIDGYFIPGRVIVGVPTYTLHRTDSAFEQPFDFVPERWLEPDNITERQRCFAPFGIGARSCIGKFLAQAEIRACLHAVYCQYRTKPAEDMTADMSFEDQVLTSRPRGTCCKLEFVPVDRSP